MINTETTPRTRTGPTTLLGCSPGERLLTAEEVAEWLGVPIATIYAWRYRRSGPTAYKVGRHLRYRRGDVEAWLETLRTEPAPAHRLGGLLGVTPARSLARWVAPARARFGATPESPDPLSRLGFATPGAQGANPRPHPLTVVSDRGRGLGVADAAGSRDGEIGWRE